MKWFSKSLLTLALSAALSGGVLAQGENIASVPASIEGATRYQVLDGVIEAVKQSTVSSQTSGELIELSFDVDDYVKKGQIVARLRDREQRSGLSQAKASFNEAQARFDEAENEYQRIRDLYKQKTVSKSKLDGAKAGREAASARLEAAKAGLTKAKEQLGYTEVRAPFNGYVIERHVEIGEVANVGTPLMSGFSLNELRVNVDVPQRLLNTVREYSEAKVTFTHEDRVIESKKLTFFPYADARTNTFKVRVLLPKNIEGVFPGMFVKVAFKTGEKEQLMIPAKAVAYRSEVTGVYVRKDGKIAFRQILLGKVDEHQRAHILSGLSNGEEVLLDPIQAGVALKESRKATKQAQGEGHE